jgi:hypothetical protein
MNRTGLIVLQVVGALSLLPYPFVLLANVMSIAAPKQTPLGALPFLALSVYPLIWIALWIFSWRAMARGEAGLAFALSSVPLLACAVAVGLYAYGWASTLAAYSAQNNDMRQAVEPKNPLLWTLSAGSSAEALKAIETHPELVNVAVEGHGSPLNNALLKMPGANFDGTFREDSSGAIAVVRALVAHGARLTGEERENMWRSWQLRRALYDGPVTTEMENPLVWRIVTRKMGTYDSMPISVEDEPYLNKPTRLHGSPMYALLVTNGFWIFPDLWKAGARLTPEEQQDPAAAKALAQMREKHPELK